MPAKLPNPVSSSRVRAARLVVELVKATLELHGEVPHLILIKRAVGRYRHLRRFARGSNGRA